MGTILFKGGTQKTPLPSQTESIQTCHRQNYYAHQSCKCLSQATIRCSNCSGCNRRKSQWSNCCTSITRGSCVNFWNKVRVIAPLEFPTEYLIKHLPTSDHVCIFS